VNIRLSWEEGKTTMMVVEVELPFTQEALTIGLQALYDVLPAETLQQHAILTREAWRRRLSAGRA
jgi:hypothetical protein